MRQIITSTHNPQIKAVVRLRAGKHRRKNEQFLIDGVREITRAIRLQVPITVLFVDTLLFQDGKPIPDETQQLLQIVKKQNIPICEVSEQIFLKIAFGNRNEGVVALAEPPDWNLGTIQLPENPLIAVSEWVEKPGNVGAIFRSADGAGMDAVIIAAREMDIFHPSTIRASMGTVFRSNSAVATTEETIDWLLKKNVQIVAAKCDGAVPHLEIDFTLPTAIVLGSEANGLTLAWNRHEIQAVKIPMLGIADSLNVSNAAAILFYEARRQRMAITYS